jgi:hypothetical protein
MKLFDFVEWVLSVYINPPVSAVGIKYLTLLSFLIVYQPHVSCWYETILFCWVFSVCISPVSAIGMKLFDFAEFLCVYQPRVSCWYETIWFYFSSLCVYQPDVSCWFEIIWLCWLFLCVYQLRVGCWFETIWLLSFLSIYQPCVSCWWLSYFQVICFATKKFYVIFVKVKKKKNI